MKTALLLSLVVVLSACDDSGSKKNTNNLNNTNNANNSNNLNNANNLNNTNNQVCPDTEDTKRLHWYNTSLKIYYGAQEPALCMAGSQKLAVGALLSENRGVWSNICTGTLVTGNHILTAAHCVTDYRGRPKPASDFRFAFGPDSANPVAVYELVSLAVNPSYSGYSARTGHDHAVLVLQGSPMDDLGISPLPIHRVHPGYLVGQYVQQGGYGITQNSSSNARLWWTPELVSGVDDRDGELIVNGQGFSSVCNGDSGGPSLYPVDGNVLTILGTVSYGDPSCVDRDYYGRTDWDLDFLDANIPAFDYCAGLDEKGVCDGNIARWCEGGLPRTECCDAVTGPCELSVNGYARCDVRRNPCASMLDFKGTCQDNTAFWCWGGLVFSRSCTACGGTCTPNADPVFGAYCN